MDKKQTLNSPGVIIKSSFYDCKHQNWNWMTNNSISSKKRGSSKSSYYSHLDYIGRKTEATLIIKSERTLGYLNYLNQEYKVTSGGHFTQDGIFSNSDMKKEIKNDKRYQITNKSLVWSTVISFSQDFFKSNHIPFLGI